VISRLLALSILFLLLVLLPRVSNSALPEQRGFVAKTRTQTLFVFGSTHWPQAEDGKAAVIALSPCFKSVAIEIDDSRKWGKTLADSLPLPTLLSGNVLSEADIANMAVLLSRRFNRNVSPLEVANVPAANLYYTLLGLPLVFSGSRAGLGAPLEVWLLETARRDGLPVRPISYGEDHGHVLGSIKGSDWTKILTGLFLAISNAERDYQSFVKEVESLESLNSAGNFDAAFDLADAIQKRRFGNPFGGSFLHQVHKSWIKRLRNLGDGSHVVVLGTNHLGGKTGIKHLLSQAGYQIKNTTIADANCVK
jgi:uncharacterized protein YbaP (TraB family)